MDILPEQIFKTKVVGITQGERQRHLATLSRSTKLRLVREATTSKALDSLAVFVGNDRLGLLKKDISELLLPLMDEGIEFKVWLESVVKAPQGHLECFVEIFYRGPKIDVPGIRSRSTKQNRKANLTDSRRRLGALVFLLCCSLAAATIGGMLTATSVSTWYPTIAKPVWTPPNWVFGPVWTTLYAMMAVAAWQVWKTDDSKYRNGGLRLYFAQLLLNTAWSGVFFGLKSPLLGLFEILVFWLALTATVISFWRVKKVAGVLLIPYLVWATYAGILNFAIWKMNA